MLLQDLCKGIPTRSEFEQEKRGSSLATWDQKTSYKYETITQSIEVLKTGTETHL